MTANKTPQIFAENPFMCSIQGAKHFCQTFTSAIKDVSERFYTGTYKNSLLPISPTQSTTAVSLQKHDPQTWSKTKNSIYTNNPQQYVPVKTTHLKHMSKIHITPIFSFSSIYISECIQEFSCEQQLLWFQCFKTFKHLRTNILRVI